MEDILLLGSRPDFWVESVGYQQLVKAATLGRVKLVFWGSLVRADSHWRVLFLV